jgi:hypothetical protein
MNFGDPDWPLNERADGFDVAFDFSKPLSLLILPIDLPISFVVDTVLLPMDLFNWRMEVVNQRYVRQALYSENMPSAEEFRKNYKRLYSQHVIRGYLHEPSDRISQARLDMLLNAGVYTGLMAESKLISEDFANRLIDRILFEARNAKDWEENVLKEPIATLLQNKALSQNKMIPPAILKRIAGLGNKKLLPFVAKDERTPPDVLRILLKEDSCIEIDCRLLVAGNSSSPPDVLSKLAGDPKCFDPILKNHSTPTDALLKMTPLASGIQLYHISSHLNATPAVDAAIIKYGKQMFAKGDLSIDEILRLDLGLTALARKDLPRHKLLELAVLPLGKMLEALSNNRNADAEILATIVNTCRQRFAKVDLHSDGINSDAKLQERMRIDSALAALARKDLPRHKLLELAVLPLGKMLEALSNNRNADAEILATIVNTCRNHKVGKYYDYDSNYFGRALENAQERLNNPKERLNTK